MKQQRAERTRLALIDAAAEQFARHGYAGTSLSRICDVAGVSMGALTFHFPVKEDLARVICELCQNAARRGVRQLDAAPADCLAAIARLLSEVGRLLEEDVGVRAAVRLSQGDPDRFPSWNTVWLPPLRALLLRLAQEQGQSREPADLADLERVVTYFLAGAYVDAKEGCAPGQVGERLNRSWQLVCRGVTAGQRVR